ncbi:MULTISPECIES: hypothetical protein [Chryseobacterium]|uniref:hypothetical protein n=1 Tax=Chryseobacterium TaxID=59732 RepID=UPI001297881C|nr:MULTISPECIES: hypothetical protein [Chryseobacterium]MDR6919218.1 hypothetical protein [Chryseobacterium sp. 2987]
MKQILIIFSCLITLTCCSQKKEDTELTGKWVGKVKESTTQNAVEKIVLEFTKDGKYIQHTGEGKMKHTTESSYKTENGKVIITETETGEKTEVKYAVKNDTLTIVFEGVENKFVKQK